MAEKRWEGGARAVAQVNTWTFSGTWETADIVLVQIGNKIVPVTTLGTTGTTAATAVYTALAALSAADYPEFAEITWTNPSAGVVTGTAATAGKPFTATFSTTESDGGAADDQRIEGGTTATTGTVSTASAGPEDWSTAANWSDGAIPANTDTVWLDSFDGDILYGLSQSAVTLTLLNITSTFTGRLGLPLTNADATEYPEYRADYLAIGATTCNIGAGTGEGSQRIKINFGSVQTTTTVYRSATGEDDDLEAILLKGTHASNALNLVGGEVGVAVLGGETSTANVLKVGGGAEAAQVRLGSGVTLNTATQYSGDLEINSAVVTSLTQEGGACTINGTGAVAQLTQRAGTLAYNTTGALNGNAVIAGVLTFDGDQRAKSVPNPIEVYGGGQVIDTNHVVVSTAQVQSFDFAGTWEADDIVNVKTCGQGTVTYDFTAGSTTEATVIDNIVAEWNGLSATTYPEFAKVTASRSGDTLLLTAKSAGTPFVFMLTPYESDGTTAADAQTIEGGLVATLGTTDTANARLVTDWNQSAPGLSWGANIRLYRAGVA